MIKFEINKKYYDSKRNCYTILNRTGDFIEVKFNKIIKKYRVVTIGDVECAVYFGETLFKAGINKIKYNDEIDSNFVETKKINPENIDMGYFNEFRRTTDGN